MFEIGRLCLKIAGRDAGLKCIVIDKLNDNYVLIDGQTRRRKCNVKHLEPLDKVLKVSKGASHEDVVKELKKQGIEIKEKTKRSKKTKKTEEAKTEEKPEAKETVKKQETPAMPKTEKKPEAEPKKTVVKKAKAKPKAKKTTEKIKEKAKTTKK